MKKSVCKQDEEKATIAYMVTYYCKHNHHEKGLCRECQTLLDYANQRIDTCPFMETKTFCSACKVHCYKKDMRERIREVMRYSGPRMLFHKPIMALRHVYIEHKEKNL